MRKIKLKRIIGIIVIGLIIAASLLIILFTGRDNNNLPRLSSVPKMSNYSFGQLEELVKTLEEKDLIKAWGKPQVTKYRRVWSAKKIGDTRYVVADVEDGKVASLCVSDPIYITVVCDENGTKWWLCDWDDFTTDINALVQMETEDGFGNEITCEVGDKIKAEYIGGLMESWPGQLAGSIYGYKTVGHISDLEVSNISKAISKYLLHPH